MRSSIAFAALSMLLLSGCGGGAGEQQPFEDQQSKIARLRGLADARCMCLMNDDTDERCNFAYDDERKGLKATPMPPMDFAITAGGSCFATLDGQCVTEGYHLKGGGPADNVCSQDDAIALNDLHEKVTTQSGKAAADAAAKERIREIRVAWRAR
ncbi:hypothetical protein [Sphingopyxis sp. YR583]|uniref:hypothetical protein n=1 Tax=Sphingopyxis sp. YR583 TaxID=1881047 RepID=UPI00115FE3DC|nr:hypothetical protein [Sphingopyxis sp. YR583]